MTAREGRGPTRRVLLAAPSLLLAARAARAQGTPPRALTMLVGAPPNTPPDRWCRGFAPFLERHLPGVRVELANRPGEGGILALDELAGAATDGSVLGYATTPYILARAVERQRTDLLSRLRFVAAVAEDPVVLVAPPGTDLAALRAGRGQSLALPPPSSAPALAASSIEESLPLPNIHFPSGAAARQAAQAGNVAAALLSLPEAIGALREGRLAGLGIATRKRVGLLPEVPTMAEAGLPLEAGLQRGFVLPAGAGANAVDMIARALRDAAADPEFIAQGDQTGFLPRFLSEEQWRRQIAAEMATLNLRWETAPWPQTRG